MPTEIQLDTSEHFAALESFTGPPALERHDPIYGGRIVRYFAAAPTFRRKLLVAADAKPGTARVTGRIDLVIANPRTKKTIRARQYPFEATFEVLAAPSVLEPAKAVATGALPGPAAAMPPTAPSTPTQSLAERLRTPTNPLLSTPYSPRPRGKGAELQFDIELDDLTGVDPLPAQKSSFHVGPYLTLSAIAAGLGLLVKKTWNP
jgi:hypothetical protein